VLYPSGEIKINYNTINGNYTASVGIQNNGIVGTLYTFDNENLSENFTLSFNTGPDWLSLATTSGTVEEGTSQNINFTSDATGLMGGNYHGYINVQSNGGSEGISVSLIVGAGGITGDINNDNSVNVLDIVIIVNHILEGEYNYAADINNDNSVDVLDIVIIVNYILENS